MNDMMMMMMMDVMGDGMGGCMDVCIYISPFFVDNFGNELTSKSRTCLVLVSRSSFFFFFWKGQKWIPSKPPRKRKS